jgi:hypothetical protein
VSPRGQQPVAARHIHLAVQHDAGAVAGGHGFGAAGVVQHLGHVAVCPLGNTCTGARLHAAGGHTAPEHAAALEVSRLDDENFSTHCTGKEKRHIGLGSGGAGNCSSIPAAWGRVAAPAGLFGCGITTFQPLQGRHGHGGTHGCRRRSAKACSACLMLANASTGSATASSLFTANTMRGHAQQFTSSAVAAGLRQQRSAGLAFQSSLVASTSTTAASALLAAVTMLRVYCSWPGASPMMNLRDGGGEVAVGHVDGDALLALGAQAVGQQRQVDLARCAARWPAGPAARCGCPPAGGRSACSCRRPPAAGDEAQGVAWCHFGC